MRSEKFKAIVKELFIRCRKLNISIVFITQSYFRTPIEYSPLGKVFTDGLDKSYKKEGLLKRLKYIEDKSNNQLLAIKNISRPAIKGRNGNGNDIDIDDDNYKKIQDCKKK